MGRVQGITQVIDAPKGLVQNIAEFSLAGGSRADSLSLETTFLRHSCLHHESMQDPVSQVGLEQSARRQKPGFFAISSVLMVLHGAASVRFCFSMRESGPACSCMLSAMHVC